MKRAIVTVVRESVDENTKEPLVFVSMGVLPSKMKDGGLWYQKKDGSFLTTCFGKNRNENAFNFAKSLLPGAIVDVIYGVNEFTGKTFVASLSSVCDSPFSENVLYS